MSSAALLWGLFEIHSFCGKDHNSKSRPVEEEGLFVGKYAHADKVELGAGKEKRT